MGVSTKSTYIFEDGNLGTRKWYPLFLFCRVLWQYLIIYLSHFRACDPHIKHSGQWFRCKIYIWLKMAFHRPSKPSCWAWHSDGDWDWV